MVKLVPRGKRINVGAFTREQRRIAKNDPKAILLRDFRNLASLVNGIMPQALGNG